MNKTQKSYTREEILDKVKKLIAEVLNIDAEKINAGSKIIDDLGAESLDIVTLLMEFEDTYQMKIPDEDAEHMLTVNDAVDYIMNMLEENRAKV